MPIKSFPMQPVFEVPFILTGIFGLQNDSVPSLSVFPELESTPQIGLSYLTGGFGTVLGGYANGKLMDMNYKIVAKKIGHTIDRVAGDDLKDFPIESARARGPWCLLLCYIGALAGYGWSVHARAHESIPLILQSLLVALCTSFQQTFNTLLVDISPRSPSTAAASSTITRCLLSAVAVAALQPLINVIGRNWFFTMLAICSGGGGLGADWATKKYGMQWRLRRLAKTTESVRPINNCFISSQYSAQYRERDWSCIERCVTISSLASPASG